MEVVNIRMSGCSKRTLNSENIPPRTCRPRAEQDPQRPIEVKAFPFDLAIGCTTKLLVTAFSYQLVPVLPTGIPVSATGNIEWVADNDHLGMQGRLLREIGQ